MNGSVNLPLETLSSQNTSVGKHFLLSNGSWLSLGLIVPCLSLCSEDSSQKGSPYCLLSDAFPEARSTVNTPICSHRLVSMQELPMTLLSALLERKGAEIEADSVSVGWGIQLGSHYLSLTNRGLQCTTELFATAPLRLFTVCCTCRRRQRGRIDLYRLGRILDVFKE